MKTRRVQQLLPLCLVSIPLWGSSCSLIHPAPAGGGDGAGLTTSEGNPQIADEFIPSMRIVIEALRIGDEEVVRSVLIRMRARGASGGTLEWIEGVERGLVGRRMVADLDLTLEVRELALDGGGTTRILGLRAKSVANAGGPLSFSISPPVLKIERTWIDASGQDGQESDSVGIETMTSFQLNGEEGGWIPILPLTTPRGQAAAVREIWSLEMHHCYFKLAGEKIPVNAPRVRSCERYLLGSHLQLGWLEPDAVAKFAMGSDTPNTSQLVERAVRTRPSDWAIALDHITAELDKIPQSRLEQLAPVLRWFAAPEVDKSDWGIEQVFSTMDSTQIVSDGELVHPSVLRHDPKAWKLWLLARQQLRDSKSTQNLDLPAGG